MTEQAKLEEITKSKGVLPSSVAKNNRFRNRSKMSLIANILRIAEKGIPRTHLMYKANLSHRMLRNYVPFLIQQGLLEEVTNEPSCRSTVYRTSRRGNEYLETYSALLNIATGLKRFTPFAERFLEEQGFSSN
jgi:predicted transcriptional regulator